MKTNRGFSLIELMIAVAIAAILIGIAVPSFNNMLAGNRLATQANDVISAIMFARSEAIQRNQTITFCRADSATANVCSTGANWTDWIVTNNPGAGAAANTLRRGVFARSGEVMQISSTLAASQMAFRSNGLADVAGGANTLRLCYTGSSSDNIRVLDIAISGRVTVQTSSGGC